MDLSRSPTRCGRSPMSSRSQEAGVEHIVMLTGDNRPRRTDAAATGIEEVRAELLPADKVTAVEELVADTAPSR